MDSPIPPARRRRFSLLLPVLLFSFAACRIEQTPTRYIDRLETPEEEIQASMEELTDRLLSTAPSLQRRDLGDVLAALAPHPDMAALAPASDTVLTSATQLGLALSQAAEGGGIEMSDLDVEVSPENTVAWFRAAYRVVPDSGVPGRVHFTGVFVRQEGDWRLRQGHVSLPLAPEDSTPADPDSLRATG